MIIVSNEILQAWKTHKIGSVESYKFSSVVFKNCNLLHNWTWLGNVENPRSLNKVLISLVVVFGISFLAGCGYYHFKNKMWYLANETPKA